MNAAPDRVPGPSRPGGRSARVQAAVHRAATELVCELGADRVTMPAVAARAGVNPTTVYRRWGTVAGLLADVALVRHDTDRPPEPTGALDEDLAGYAAWALADFSRPGGIAFFRAEVAPDPDDRRAGLARCLDRCAVRIDALLAKAAERGRVVPTRQQVIDRIIAPLYFRVVFSIPHTDEAYARALAADLLDHPDFRPGRAATG
ncbi:TetR family transcriptional regulator [Embleya scabrispora]|uniref:TetR family transcriptional regulator n=1 Tax=Embleya scabrispora TaxID=159449 RepID=A0A1T3NSR5_9ACTN|nr:TetR/AcrR family transcriptional regulator [Embleya scabrispora]OPC79722.1 TetR family transcriptional regulator [Embleya scabrispora]